MTVSKLAGLIQYQYPKKVPEPWVDEVINFAKVGDVETASQEV